MKTIGIGLILLFITRGYSVLQAPIQPFVPTELYERKGNTYVIAPADDLVLARTYSSFNDKGPAKGGQRITILTAKNTYKVGEEIRVLHVLEAITPGLMLWVMGPKTIYAEFIDGQLVTAGTPRPTTYDGLVRESPGVEFNYDITKYTFQQPGRHAIQWKGGGHETQGVLGLESNVIQLSIVN